MQRKPWTEKEIQYLKDNVDRNTKDVAKELGRSYSATIKARQWHGINRLKSDTGIEGENWKLVESYEILEVSNFGRLRNSTRKNILKSTIDKNGYCSVNIKTVGGKGKNLLVHSLVAKAFLPNPTGKVQVNHLDGVKTNNALDNLEWVTPSENIKHAYATGLMPKTRNRK